MAHAHILTIGTEITGGEVINSNAAWLSTRLEDLGLRVNSHLTVRDQPEEILRALQWPTAGFVFVTGGLGPTSDDMTRACLAEHLAVPLEFDTQVWESLNKLYQQRGLPIREAHRHQCWFPQGSERLQNPTGTALGFYFQRGETHYFSLPGPPRELEGMFAQEVLPLLKKLIAPSQLSWQRWSVFAVPESEVAELVEPVLGDSGLEVGYRAQVPYVRVKVFAHIEKHKKILAEIRRVLEPSLVENDLAEDLLKLWPDPTLNLTDEVSDGVLAQRLYSARRQLIAREQKDLPRIQLQSGGFSLSSLLEGFCVKVKNSKVDYGKEMTLPYKIPLDSERGRRSAAEWALWLGVQSLRR